MSNNTNSQTQTSNATLLAEIERLRRENANIRAAKSACHMRVSDKGGVSVYGLGKFPVTLYAEQWAKLLAMAPAIEAFITENKAALSTKPVKATEPVKAQAQTVVQAMTADVEAVF